MAVAPEAVSLGAEEALAREISVPDAVAAAVKARSVVAITVSRPREEGGAGVVPRRVEAVASAAVADPAIGVVPAMQARTDHAAAMRSDMHPRHRSAVDGTMSIPVSGGGAADRGEREHEAAAAPRRMALAGMRTPRILATTVARRRPVLKHEACVYD